MWKARVSHVIGQEHVARKSRWVAQMETLFSCARRAIAYLAIVWVLLDFSADMNSKGFHTVLLRSILGR
jgi:hypothetical protein